MRVSVFDDMSLCTEQEVNRMLPLVSDQRREQALKFKLVFGRFACLKSYLMLSELTGLTEFGFTYNEYGKPSIAGHPEIHFSISHCQHAIAVAVSDSPVGIDVESFRKADDALLHRTMNEDEIRMVEASDCRERAFIELWTRKEAVFKLMGTGITDDILTVLSGNAETETSVNDALKYVVSTAVYL